MGITSFPPFLLLQKVEGKGGLVDNYIAVIAAPVCDFFWLASSVLKILPAKSLLFIKWGFTS